MGLRARTAAFDVKFSFYATLTLLSILCLVLVGCSGGYPGMGVTSLTSSASTIDAGQSVTLSVNSTASMPVTWSVSCASSSCGTVSNAEDMTTVFVAPLSVAAPIKVTVTATTTNTNNKATKVITVNPAPVISATPSSGTLGVAYSTTLATTGGTGTVTLSKISGSLPPGLTFNASTGVVSGTPTSIGTFTFTVQAVDQSDVPYTVTTVVTIVITTAGTPLSVVGGNPPSGVVGAPYLTALTAAGGTAPYTWSITSGALPTGTTLSASTGIISGIPTTKGTYTFTAQATDAAGAKATGSFSITIADAKAPLTITVSTLPGGTVAIPYSATIGVSGGTAPYTCTIVTGTLPPGLSIGAGCVVSGTPTTAGTYPLTIQVTDSAMPAAVTTGPVSITIAAAPVLLTLTSPPAGTMNTAYDGLIQVSGGTAPYSCVLKSGTLQTGLTLGSNCHVTGTPTTSGSATISVQATDAASPANTVTGNVVITISAASTLTISTGTLPGGTVGIAYSSTIGVTGGTSPYSCTITSGALPAGLTLGAGCVISGTPTVQGTATLTVNATDASSPVKTGSGPVSITIAPAAVVLVLGTPPTGTIGTVYTGSVPVTGGTGPYTCSVKSGALPTGLTLHADCSITGTPTVAGPATAVVTVTDSSSPANTNTGNVTITINAPTVTLTLGTPAAATVQTPYTGTIPVTGGTGPYSCTINSGTLPAGLKLGAQCTITGTPTAVGSSTVNVTATDSATHTVTGNVTFVVNPLSPLTFFGSLPNATVGVAYTQTLTANGGLAPYTYAVTAGALPAGLTLSSTGTISGTPTAAGAASFTITATDSESTPQTAPLPLVLLVVYPTTPYDGALKGPYAFLFQGYDDVVAGVLAYQTATVGAFTADGSGVLTTGELDSNHQSSTPTGTTIVNHPLIGTYTLGSDYRGSLTVSTLASDGTVASNATYAIAVKAPTAPATVSTSGSFIESDGNQLVGTRGSATFLAQTTAAFSTGLSGSYAFGLSGDTACLVACTVNLTPGPVAAVGQFTTGASGTIPSGTGDTMVATTHYAQTALAGTLGAADLNGRLQMSMSNNAVGRADYPTDFAVYVVDATHAYVMSTDKHSSYILLAGSATAQSTTTFSNASMTGNYVGYENAQSNPGIAGVALQNVLNLSTATIFSGTANSTGTCNTTHVEIAGLTGLVNTLTGLGSNSAVLNALLGTYQSTGNAACTVAANGRAVLNYPVPSSLLGGVLSLLGLGNNPPAPRIAYLSSADTGYFLESGYAGLGRIEQQSGVPSSLASLKGTYVYGTAPASSLASINTSGEFTADGAGHATTTTDANVGVGNLNLIQLGVGSTSTYVVSDAAAGRFTLGATSVIYEISPSRFVLLDTNPLTTSPSVALLY